MDAITLPTVSAMMVRQFTPTGRWDFFGGVLVMDTFDVSEVEIADARIGYDDDAVDCSNRIFQITNWLMMDDSAPANITCFPSRRWRNMREGENIVGHPSAESPLLYIGNPVRITKGEDGISVFGRGEFIIKSGVELGY